MMKLRWQAMRVCEAYEMPEARLVPAVKNEYASYIPPATCELFELSFWRSIVLMYVVNALTPASSIDGRLYGPADGYFMMPPQLLLPFAAVWPNIISPTLSLPLSCGVLPIAVIAW